MLTYANGRSYPQTNVSLCTASHQAEGNAMESIELGRDWDFLLELSKHPGTLGKLRCGAELCSWPLALQ